MSDASSFSVVITGASTGIGRATAKFLVERGCRVFGGVRKSADAEAARAELGERFIPLLFDVTDEAATHAAAAQVRAELNGATLRGLVNNAGLGLGGPLMHQPVAEIRRQLEVNTLGPLIVTQAFLPQLGADRSLKGPPGRIVNITSVGGKIGAPFLGGYVASKHALEGLSETLRRELQLYGIDVVIIGPGAVATPIWDKVEALDRTPYAKTDYAEILERFEAWFVTEGRKGLPPERIAKGIWHALTTPKPKVRYAIVQQPLTNWILPNLLPKRVVDRLIAGRLGLTPAKAP